MKRITSVEYLARMLQPIMTFDTEPARELYRKVLAEASEKHQDEIREAYNAGIGKYFKGDKSDVSSSDYYKDRFEINKP